MMVIRVDGSVWAWGSNKNGECDDHTPANLTRPVEVQFPVLALFLPLVRRYEEEDGGSEGRLTGGHGMGSSESDSSSEMVCCIIQAECY